ncbi:hypothetical protein ANN_00520 [Periplaneta americana]|uniref:Gustatory receptor n=1 Tax=Periplaneta americana TaxID=6978 RepID=A0ABQ8TR23_PERAM|nr:hypothetical protein ANN_00520 [Periplaneta americana]
MDGARTTPVADIVTSAKPSLMSLAPPKQQASFDKEKSSICLQDQQQQTRISDLKYRYKQLKMLTESLNSRKYNRSVSTSRIMKRNLILDIEKAVDRMPVSFNGNNITHDINQLGFIYCKLHNIVCLMNSAFGIPLLLIATFCHYTAEEYKESITNLHKFLLQSELHKCVMKELCPYLALMRDMKPELLACGMKINLKYFYSTIGIMCTYFVVLLQTSSIDRKRREFLQRKPNDVCVIDIENADDRISTGALARGLYQIRKWRLIHFKLYDAVELINSAFGLPFLFAFFYIFCGAISMIYFGLTYAHLEGALEFLISGGTSHNANPVMFVKLASTTLTTEFQRYRYQQENWMIFTSGESPIVNYMTLLNRSTPLSDFLSSSLSVGYFLV